MTPTTASPRFHVRCRDCGHDPIRGRLRFLPDGRNRGLGLLGKLLLGGGDGAVHRDFPAEFDLGLRVGAPVGKRWPRDADHHDEEPEDERCSDLHVFPASL